MPSNSDKGLLDDNQRIIFINMESYVLVHYFYNVIPIKDDLGWSIGGQGWGMAAKMAGGGGAQSH